ncbi:MAG TPA: hypothetical protein VFE52_10150, partial [Devosia sp.]|nr:hypothetical protein [Devosia sp.]
MRMRSSPKLYRRSGFDRSRQERNGYGAIADAAKSLLLNTNKETAGDRTTGFLALKRPFDHKPRTPRPSQYPRT